MSCFIVKNDTKGQNQQKAITQQLESLADIYISCDWTHKITSHLAAVLHIWGGEGLDLLFPISMCL